MSGSVAGEAVRILGVGALNVVVLWLADLGARRARLGPEAARKLVHVASGAVAAPLPWILRTPVSMVVLAAGAVAALWLVRRMGLLRSVHGVARASLGDLLFPVGVMLLFLVGRSQPMLYLVGLSYMVVSDALAALIGRHYGRATYEVERQRRSVEGSITFFVVSFLAAHLILLLATDVPREASVLVALQLAILATCFEAISLGGNDNLFVPVITCLLVMRLVEVPPEILARDLLAQLTIGGTVAYLAIRTGFAGTAGVITLGLFLYGAYALGGLLWLAPPVLVAGTYILARRWYWGGVEPPDRHFQVVAVFHVVAVGASIYLEAAWLDATGGWRGGSAADAFFLPYLGAAAGQLAIMIYTLWRPWSAPGEILDPGLLPVVLAGAIVAPLAAFATGRELAALLWILATPLVTLVLYRRARNGVGWPRHEPWHARLQVATVAAALLALVPLHVALFSR